MDFERLHDLEQWFFIVCGLVGAYYVGGWAGDRIVALGKRLYQHPLVSWKRYEALKREHNDLIASAECDQRKIAQLERNQIWLAERISSYKIGEMPISIYLSLPDAVIKMLWAKDQPRDPATGKFCKRGG